MYCDLKQKDGSKKTMLIRSIEREEIPLVLPYIKRYMDVDRALTPEQRQSQGIHDGLLRLSVGLEDPSDLLDDLDSAVTESRGRG
jgi:hypothetical protein